MSETSNKTLRTRLIQMEVLPGRPHDNTARILNGIEGARAEGIELVIFPEMSVPGYLIGDEWEHEAFLRECEECAHEIRTATKDIIAIFGSVAVDWHKKNEDGRVRKYNALFVAENGTFLSPENGPCEFVIKTLMPNYREFDDSRHFFDLRKLSQELGRSVADLTAPVRTTKAILGCALCEDAWDSDYSFSPLTELARRNADLLIDISCSPFTLHKNHKRNRVFSAKAVEL